MSQSKRRAIIVLGMHRSGTSALTGVLGLLGVRLPVRLLHGNSDNPKGFFEPDHIVAIHERLLASAGTIWSNWDDIPDDWFLSTAGQSFFDELVAAVSEDYAAAPLFVIKDPRMCRLMPLWYRVLDRIDVKPCFAISLRNPVEVARSLQHRDGIPLAHACLLWLRYVLEAERQSRGHPRVFLRYPDLLAEPRMVIDRLRKGLGVNWPRKVESSLSEIVNFLDPSLRTQTTEERNIDDMGNFSPWIRQAFECHEALLNSPADKAVMLRLDALRATFSAANAAFTPVLKHRAERQGVELAAHQEALTTLQNEIGSLRKAFTTQQNEFAVLGTALTERDKQIAALRNTIAERDTKLTALDQALAERDRELGALRTALADQKLQVTAFGNTLAARGKRLAALDQTLAERDRTVAALHVEMVAREQSLRQSEDSNANLTAVANAALQRLHLIEASTIWQLSLPLRKALIIVPTPVRRRGRQALRLFWWLLTPHRIPARLRALRASRHSPPGPVLRSQLESIRSSPLFDADWYIAHYSDVAGMDPVEHYLLHGAANDRDPGPRFSTRAYLDRHPSVEQAGMNALAHYIEHGQKAGLTINHSDLALRDASGDYVTENFPLYKLLKPLPIFNIRRNSSRRVSIVTNSINAGSLYGGVATAVIFAALLAKRRNASLRIVTINEPPTRENVGRIFTSHGIDWTQNVEFGHCDIVHQKNPIDVTSEDMFVTTSWWSTSNVSKAVKSDRIVYLLQEDERMFYPYGDERLRCSEVLADQTLQFVVNTNMLYEYLIGDGLAHLRERGMWFEPAFPRASYFYEERERKIKNFFFYARPNNLRNLYYRGIEAIEAAIDKGVLDPEEWHFTFLGRDLKPIELHRGVKPTMLQNLRWDDYAAQVRQMDLGLSLMYTPHPSYPPLDLAASGAVAVTNRFGPKQSLDQYSRNIICVDDDVSSLVEGLRQGTALAKDLSRRRTNYERNDIKTDWVETFEPVISRLLGA